MSAAQQTQFAPLTSDAAMLPQNIGQGIVTVTNTSGSDLIIGPGTSWSNDDSITSNTTKAPSIEPRESMLSRNAMKKLVTMSSKVEELFEFKYRISPQVNVYSGYSLSFNVNLNDNRLVSDPTMPVSTYSQPLIENVQGDRKDNLRPVELLHAVAKMIHSVLVYRDFDGRETVVPREEPTDAVRNFIYEVAKGFSFKDHEVPEEALGKLALLKI